jgi:CrcB protein
MRELLLVCLGGAFGSGARYLVSELLGRRLPPGYPWGTFAVNVAGSFLLCGLVSLALAGRLTPEWRLFLATGVMGGFTTYSSFNYEVLGYFERGAPALAIGYAGATLVACGVAGLGGFAAGRWIAT